MQKKKNVESVETDQFYVEITDGYYDVAELNLTGIRITTLLELFLNVDILNCRNTQAENTATN
jgi:hypothetical protein